VREDAVCLCPLSGLPAALTDHGVTAVCRLSHRSRKTHDTAEPSLGGDPIESPARGQRHQGKHGKDSSAHQHAPGADEVLEPRGGALWSSQVLRRLEALQV